MGQRIMATPGYNAFQAAIEDRIAAGSNEADVIQFFKGIQEAFKMTLSQLQNAVRMIPKLKTGVHSKETLIYETKIPLGAFANAIGVE